ncbi:MAG: Acg family FMN-binding oxidoreductase [Beijerinckiaceae bacterium]
MPSLTRRNIILGAGGALLLAGTGAVYRVFRTADSAIAPWSAAHQQDQPQTPADVRLHAFRYAILAPNPHNRQPWIIRLIGSDEAEISCDLARRLPQTDPFDRQITIGFGCFLAIAEIAAQERGYRIEAKEFPEGQTGERLDTRPIAALRFIKDASVNRDPLFAAILQRRSTKRPFDMQRAVTAASLRTITAAASPGVVASATTDTGLVEKVRALAWQAWLIEAETPRTWGETVELMRIGAPEINANPDGVSLGGPMLEALSLAGQLDRIQMADPQSTAFKTGRERYRTMIAATPAIFWLKAAGNTRIDQLAIGRSYVRLNLAATTQGIAVHPISQALQEFPEMADTRQKIDAVLGGEQVQMLARLGYADAVPPTPRWPLAAKLTVL